MQLLGTAFKCTFSFYCIKWSCVLIELLGWLERVLCRVRGIQSSSEIFCCLFTDTQNWKLDVYECLCIKYYGDVWNTAQWTIFRSFVTVCFTAVAMSLERTHHRNSTGHLLAGRMEVQRKLQKATLHHKKMKIRSRQTANCGVQQQPRIMSPSSGEQVAKMFDLWARYLR